MVVDIVPSWRTNIRSNHVFTGQTKTTWHDTGNPSSNADGERSWLHSGAGGAYVGYNFAYHANKIIQLIPLNEITWHGGNAEGNKSWGAEQCLNTDWAGCLRTGAALHGGLCAAMGWDVDKALVQHNYWWGKHCPAQIRNRGVWPQVVQMVKDAKTKAVLAAGGTNTPTIPTEPNTPVYPKGTPVQKDGKAWDGLSTVEFQGRTYYGDPKTVTVGTSALNRRVGPKTADALIGDILPANSTFAVLGWTEGDEVDGENRWWVTPWGSHMWSGGTVEKPSAKPVEEEPFDPNTVRVVLGDKVYYPAGPEGAGREVKLVNTADLYQWASFDSKKVGTIGKDETVLVKFWCYGDSDEIEDIWWILDAVGEDEIKIGPRLHVKDTFQRPF